METVLACCDIVIARESTFAVTRPALGVPYNVSGGAGIHERGALVKELAFTAAPAASKPNRLSARLITSFRPFSPALPRPWPSASSTTPRRIRVVKGGCASGRRQAGESAGLREVAGLRRVRSRRRLRRRDSRLQEKRRLSLSGVGGGVRRQPARSAGDLAGWRGWRSAWLKAAGPPVWTPLLLVLREKCTQSPRRSLDVGRGVEFAPRVDLRGRRGR